MLMVAIMIPGLLAYQGTALMVVGKAKGKVILASQARKLFIQHHFDKKKMRTADADDVLVYSEQDIPAESPLAEYENLKIALVMAEASRLSQKQLFATVIREEKNEKRV